MAISILGSHIENQLLSHQVRTFATELYVLTSWVVHALVLAPTNH